MIWKPKLIGARTPTSEMKLENTLPTTSLVK